MKFVMNWDQIKSGWNRITNQVQGNWRKLTDDELTIIALKRDQLISFLQESYGYEKEQAERELDQLTQGRASHAAAAKSVQRSTMTPSATSWSFPHNESSVRFANRVTETRIF